MPTASGTTARPGAAPSVVSGSRGSCGSGSLAIVFSRRRVIVPGFCASGLVFAPHGVENGQQNGESDAENPGEIPHRVNSSEDWGKVASIRRVIVLAHVADGHL